MTTETSVAFLDGVYDSVREKNWARLASSVVLIVVIGKFLMSTVGSLPLVTPLLTLLGAFAVLAWLFAEKTPPSERGRAPSQT